MAKVLFINPSIREEDVPKHVPYGMAVLASIIMEQGHQVQVYDHNAWRQSDDVIRQVIEADAWDVIGTGGISTAYKSLRKIGALAREHAPDALTVLGGGGLTAQPQDMLQLLPQFDLGVVGEAFV